MIDGDAVTASPASRLRMSLTGRVLVVVAVAVAYGWAAPEFLQPRRYDQSSWTTFLVLHAVTFAGVIVVALSRRPRFGNLLLATATLLAWAYLFFFVWFNSWGT